jgi:hypothetical protein
MMIHRDRKSYLWCARASVVSDLSLFPVTINANELDGLDLTWMIVFFNTLVGASYTVTRHLKIRFQR